MAAFRFHPSCSFCFGSFIELRNISSCLPNRQEGLPCHNLPWRCHSNRFYAQRYQEKAVPCSFYNNRYGCGFSFNHIPLLALFESHTCNLTLSVLFYLINQELKAFRRAGFVFDLVCFERGNTNGALGANDGCVFGKIGLGICPSHLRGAIDIAKLAFVGNVEGVDGTLFHEVWKANANKLYAIQKRLRLNMTKGKRQHELLKRRAIGKRLFFNRVQPVGQVDGIQRRTAFKGACSDSHGFLGKINACQSGAVIKSGVRNKRQAIRQFDLP